MTPSKAPLPLIGTWKLSKCETSRPDLPYPTGGITKFTQQGDAIDYSNDAVWSDGRTAKVTALLKLDGSWCPVTGSMVADSLSLQDQAADGSFVVKIRKGGADVGSTRSTYSADGRTMTGYWTMAAPGGTMTWTTTLERQ